ncbi:unnamed protein product [Rotaria sp. Silwood1]|nr:unnamed protein product [Rotaria sp. Silwood1]CAF0956087.1 unnamed protein product [Rotaria sp. Silwood1]CAF3417164.1 unnamed protein product [Rotaria sp. Silwood1]CAF4609482.1 unnamed protein product [Rotaria sp. Silwood1]
MQSVDEFTPSTTEPVFGSGLVSQTKTQASTNNENSDNEKVAPSSESVTNGPNDTTNDTENATTNDTENATTNDTENATTNDTENATTNDTENTTNGTTESVTENIDAGDSTAVHGNSQSEKPTVETMNETKPTEEPIPVEKSEQVELTVPSTTEPEPVLSTPIDTTNEGSSITIDTEPPPPAVVAVVATTTTNDNVPEVPKPSDSETTEPKSKTPRSKPKTSVVSTTPTRHSARGRKTASSSSTNIEENQTNDDTGATTTTTTTTNQNESSKRIKRQAATIAKDAITASNQPNSTSGSSIGDDGNDQDVIPSDGDEDDDVTGNKSKKSSPIGRKKRRASASPTSVTKKTKGKNSITSTSNIDNEGKKVQTPPKRARTSSPKKTPEPPSEEYVRKLRPRK